MYALFGLHSSVLFLQLDRFLARASFRPGPRLAGVTLLDMPAAKSDIASEPGGVYMGNKDPLRCVVGSLYYETNCVHGSLLALL